MSGDEGEFKKRFRKKAQDLLESDYISEEWVKQYGEDSLWVNCGIDFEDLLEIVEDAKKEIYECRNYYAMRKAVERWFGSEQK